MLLSFFPMCARGTFIRSCPKGISWYKREMLHLWVYVTLSGQINLSLLLRVLKKCKTVLVTMLFMRALLWLLFYSISIHCLNKNTILTCGEKEVKKPCKIKVVSLQELEISCSFNWRLFHRSSNEYKVSSFFCDEWYVFIFEMQPRPFSLSISRTF